LKTLEGHEDPILAAVFSPDGATVLTGSRDGTAKLWSSDSGECLKTLEGVEGAISAAAFSPDFALGPRAEVVV
jgi:WD40 repeat protein